MQRSEIWVYTDYIELATVISFSSIEPKLASGGQPEFYSNDSTEFDLK